MAQFGRALRSGRRGRGFESRRIDSKGFPSMGENAVTVILGRGMKALKIKGFSLIKSHPEMDGFFMLHTIGYR